MPGADHKRTHHERADHERAYYERWATRAMALLGRWNYILYIGASLFALGVDFGLFLLALHWGFHAVGASVIGYGSGIIAHWFVSSRVVFAEGADTVGTERARQKALFFLSALVGLAVTMAIVGLGTSAGLWPLVTKAIAVVVSFQITYILRKRIVFAA